MPKCQLRKVEIGYLVMTSNSSVGNAGKVKVSRPKLIAMVLFE